MAVTTGTMMAISSGISIAGQLAQGKAYNAASEVEAMRAENVAAQQMDQARGEAERIRRSGRKTQSAARAQVAANGIKVDSGSALLIDEEIGTESEKDALNTLLTGKRQSEASRFAADQSRRRGANAVKASQLGAISTGLQGWKGVKAAEPQPEYRYKVPDYPGAEY